jgi:prepilin-type N-terminal cleavage/methylation domain-containing protein
MSARSSLAFRRRGFTLIEMLVVLGILLVLATLSVAVIPKVQERTKALRGADQMQGWLLIAKQRALRDRAPRGVRLFLDKDPATGVVIVNRLQYIEQPDPIVGVTAVFNPTTNSISIPGQDLGGTGSLQSIWPVMPNDYIQLYGGASYKIASLSYDPTMNTTTLVLLYPEITASNLPPTPITNYTITRQPRPVAGEAILQLPDDVTVDPNLSVPSITNVIATGTTYDIMFTPSGPLTGPLGDSNGKIILWVRDFTQDQDQPGQQELVTVFARTGRIGGFQVNTDPSVGGGSPYVYVLDPRNSGL